MKTRSPTICSSRKKQRVMYPIARRDQTALETYHGLTILDPYRWLENPDSEETKNFVNAQNAISIPYLHSCKFRHEIFTRLSKLWNFERYSCYYKYGNRYFYYKNNGLQDQNVVYTQTSLDEEDTPKVVLDPNTLSSDGTVALSEASFSKDGNLFAYALSVSGSDWKTAYFLNVRTGQQYPDVLKKIKFSTLEWTHDNLGVFYGCYPNSERAEGSETEKMQCQKLFFHRLGTSQKDDIFIYQFHDPLLRIGAQVSDCGNYLICLPCKDCRDNLIYFYNITENGIHERVNLIPVVEKLKHDYAYVTTRDTVNYFRTNWHAPNYQLIAIDFDDRNEANWGVVIPEHIADVLNWVAPVHDNLLLVCYIRDVCSVLQLYNVNGTKVHEFNLDMGSIVDYFAEKNCNEVFFKFQSFLTPVIIYRCDVSKYPYETTIVKEIRLNNFNPSLYTIKQRFYESYDGTKVPMFIVYHKNSPLDGAQPCLLYGYGGFSVSIQPTFNVTRIVFMQNLNGILAIANIRGGGEYGENWHNAGRKMNKQNGFNDFQAAAEYLIDKKYTSKQLLTIQGGSNGGLLIAACINQRPDLFGCAIAQVGVFDMLRFHKFTIGHAWSSDYGTANNEHDFHTLLQYSPLHNTFVPSPQGKTQYPATLLLTADHDDRVVPLHSLKFIAQLQHMCNQSNIQNNPVLIRVETKAGHGSGKPTSKQIAEATDILCFIIQSLGLQFVQN